MAKGPTVPRVCERCDRDFMAHEYRVRDGFARFCSTPCTLAWNRRQRWTAGPTSALAKLEEKRAKGGPDECWPWQGFRYKGYGRVAVTVDGAVRVIGAHRIAYEAAYGPIPAGLTVLHRCDNPPCCNPAHLFLGTNTDNNADRDAKGRQAKGERQGAAKLTAQDVVLIRASDETFVVLAERFGVSAITVAQASRGATWSHLPGARRRRQTVRRDLGSRRVA